MEGSWPFNRIAAMAWTIWSSAGGRGFKSTFETLKRGMVCKRAKHVVTSLQNRFPLPCFFFGLLYLCPIHLLFPWPSLVVTWCCILRCWNVDLASTLPALKNHPALLHWNEVRWLLNKQAQHVLKVTLDYWGERKISIAHCTRPNDMENLGGLFLALEFVFLWVFSIFTF